MHATDLNLAFAALADPTRRAIVARLASGETTVKELAKPFAVSLPAISRHLRVLESANLIRQQRQGQFRRCRLHPEGLKTATPVPIAAPVVILPGATAGHILGRLGNFDCRQDAKGVS